MGAADDRFEIIDVCTRWHRSVDHKRYADLVDVLDEVVALPTAAESSAPDFDEEGYLGSYQRARSDIIANYPPLLEGLLTQHLVAGFQVELSGDTAVCRAHSINVHFTADDPPRELRHGNEYRFDLVRRPEGWRVCGRVTWVVWSAGDSSIHDAAAKQRAWLEAIEK